MQEKLWKLIDDYFSGTITPSEERELLKWKRENPDDFQQLETVWRASAPHEDSLDFNTRQSWQELKNNILITEAVEEHQSYRYLPLLGRVAAVLIVLLGIGYYTSQRFTDSLVIVATSDKVIKKYLPDSSIVWLNKNSTLSYPEKFASTKRELHLTGEAYFEVRRNIRQPFIVITHHTETRVLGTSFNLKALKSSDTTHLTVVTGKVSFHDRDNPENKTILRPGTGTIFYAPTHKLTALRQKANLLAWKTRRLTFDKTPLVEVLADIEAYYDVKFRLRPTNYANCKFSGSFSDAALAHILETLSLSLNISFNHSGGIYAVSGNGCPSIYNE